MTVDQIRTILDLPKGSIERFSYACAVVGVSIETHTNDRWRIPSKDRNFYQQQGIAIVLQQALGAIKDYGFQNDNSLVVWL